MPNGHRHFPLLSAVAGLVLTAAGCSSDTDPAAAERPDTKHHGTKHRAATEDPAPATPDPTSDGGSSGSTTIAVYWVGDSPQGPRLFREFRRVGSGDPFGEAVDLLTSGRPLDPDYRSFLHEVAISGVDQTASGYDVTLGDDAWRERPDQMAPAEAELAVQQLVYTLQAVGQTRDPVTVSGGDRLLSQRAPFTNADFARTLNLVSITSPEQGSAVSGTLHASGVASSFEATVPWEIRQGDRVVKRSSVTAEGWMDRLYPWTADIDVSGLAPGDYTFVARTDDPTSGEGPGPHEDTKDFTIR